ncbi:MAG: stage II sporulation protein R [Clostridia bacterium]|nr:stage II sporulation protein R [Clostridia bacterium]
MDKKHIIKDIEKAVLFGLIFSIILSISSFDAFCENMRRNILRIHIIANSDSPADQSVKLRVRDALLNSCGDIFEECENLETAEQTAKENLDNFKKIADKTLSENGFSYRSEAKIGKSYFGTREYDSFTLPAGNYNSLILTLGSGKGRNWWCVIYPSVCIGSTSKKLDKSISKKSAKIANNPKNYKMRFKIIELYEKLKKAKKRKRR